MKRDRYSILEEPRGPSYKQLIEAAFGTCTQFLLVQQRRVPEPAALSVLTELQPFLIRHGRETAWPGSELAPGYSVEVYHYRLTSGSAAILSRAVDGLYEWVQLDRPEDPCFFRSDGSVWLATITQEEDAFFELTREEHDQLLRQVPDLRLAKDLSVN